MPRNNNWKCGVISETDGDDCKYLNIMKGSDICQKQMKKSVKTEYFKPVRSALKSKLNAWNVFQAIIMWAVPKSDMELE